MRGCPASGITSSTACLYQPCNSFNLLVGLAPRHEVAQPVNNSPRMQRLRHRPFQGDTELYALIGGQFRRQPLRGS